MKVFHSFPSLLFIVPIPIVYIHLFGMNIERNLNTSLVVSCYLDNYIANFYPIWLGIALPFLPDKYNLHTVFFFAFFFSLSLHHNHTTPLIYHTFLSFFLFLNIVKKLLYIKIKYKHNSFFFFILPWYVLRICVPLTGLSNSESSNSSCWDI